MRSLIHILGLKLTIHGKTKEELMDEYELTDKQREAVETLLEHGDVTVSYTHLNGYHLLRRD